jgi:DNA-binding PadR family transcriptional regulator
MKPLNYAILNFFTAVEKASTIQVMDALRPEYGDFKAFTKGAILDALLTAEANGLLEGVGGEMSEDNELILYFRAHEEGAKTIKRYIAD